MMDEYVIVNKSSLDNIGNTIRSATGSIEDIAISDLSNKVAAAVDGDGGGYMTISELMTANGYLTGSQNLCTDDIEFIKYTIQEAVNNALLQIDAERGFGYSTEAEVVPYFNDSEMKIALIAQ